MFQKNIVLPRNTNNCNPRTVQKEYAKNTKFKSMKKVFRKIYFKANKSIYNMLGIYFYSRNNKLRNLDKSVLEKNTSVKITNFIDKFSTKKYYKKISSVNKQNSKAQQRRKECISMKQSYNPVTVLNIEMTSIGMIDSLEMNNIRNAQKDTLEMNKKLNNVKNTTSFTTTQNGTNSNESSNELFRNDSNSKINNSKSYNNIFNSFNRNDFIITAEDICANLNTVKNIIRMISENLVNVINLIIAINFNFFNDYSNLNKEIINETELINDNILKTNLFITKFSRKRNQKFFRNNTFKKKIVKNPKQYCCFVA